MLTAQIYFYYPQAGQFINFHRKSLQGKITISDDTISIVSDTGETVLTQAIDSIVKVKRWAPVMTFYFRDKSKFQISFEEPTVHGGTPSKNELASSNIKPVEDYLTVLGLL